MTYLIASNVIVHQSTQAESVTTIYKFIISMQTIRICDEISEQLHQSLFIFSHIMFMLINHITERKTL